MRVQLTFHGHVCPLVRRSLRGERTLDGADFSRIHSHIARNGRAGGGQRDLTGSECGVLDFSAREAMSEVRVHQIQTDGALRGHVGTAEHSHERADASRVVHGRSQA